MARKIILELTQAEALVLQSRFCEGLEILREQVVAEGMKRRRELNTANRVDAKLIAVLSKSSAE